VLGNGGGCRNGGGGVAQWVGVFCGVNTHIHASPVTLRRNKNQASHIKKLRDDDKESLLKVDMKMHCWSLKYM